MKFNTEKELFFYIWKTKPRYCTNCKKYLGEEAKAHYFSHIKSKGLYKEMKLMPDNIQLLCLNCHYLFDFDTTERYNKKKR